MNNLEPCQAMRRARAILAAGWTVHRLATVLGTTANVLWTALESPDKWRHHLDNTNDLIDSIYRSIENEPVTPAEYLVAQTRWKTPMMWEDIDDPDETDTISTVWRECRRNPSVPLTDAVHDELHRAVEMHGSIRQLSEVLGINAKTLERIVLLDPGDLVREETLDKLSCRLLRVPICTEAVYAA